MKKFLPLLSFVGLLILNSCQKKIDEFVPDSNSLNAPDTVWQSIITSGMPVVSLKNDLRKQTVLDSFTYNNTGIVFNSGDLSLSISPNTIITPAATTPSGTITRESILLQKKGDYISQGMPTVSNGRLLISGGEFFLGLKNNNSEVTVTPGDSVTVKYSSANLFTGTNVFNATGDIVNGFDWVPNAELSHNKVNITLSGYELIINRLQWVQPAYIFDTTGIPETVFSLKLPSNYTNANSIAYISFNDMQCVADMKGSTGTRTFISGPLPINRPVTIVVISKQAGDYYLGLEQTTTSLPSSGSGTQQIVITPTKTSLAGIKSYLANL